MCFGVDLFMSILIVCEDFPLDTLMWKEQFARQLAIVTMVYTCHRKGQLLKIYAL